MSNVYFEYSCIPCKEFFESYDIKTDITNPTSENHAEKALELQLDGNRVQIIIPDILKQSFDGVIIQRVSDCYTVVDDENKDVLGAVRYPADGVYSLNGKGSEGNIYLYPDADGSLSCSGYIRFTHRGIEQKAATFFFSITHRQKRVISYTVKNTGKKVIFRIEYPFTRNEIALKVVCKDGFLPVKESDFQNELSDRLVLAPGGEKINVVQREIVSSGSESRYFRLAFAGENAPIWNRQFMLRDDTEYERKRASKGKLPTHRCPFCNEVMKPEKFKALIKGNFYTCDGKRITENWKYADYNDTVNIVCKEQFDTEYLSYSFKNPVLPSRYLDEKVMRVAVAGMPRSGKTVYLASLFGMGTDQPHEAMKNIAYMFGADKDDCSLLEYDCIDTDRMGLDRIRNSGGEMNNRKVEPINKRYHLSGDFEARTQGDEAKMLAKNPVAYSLGKLGFAYFYDVPGEVVQRRMIGSAMAFDYADCYIATVDGYPTRDDGSRYDGEAREIQSLQGLEDTVLFLEEYFKKGETDANATGTVDIDNVKTISSVPIAIVLTKYDMHLSETSDFEDDNFSESCHVTISDPAEFLKKGRAGKKYEGSALQRHIDASSMEVKSYFEGLKGRLNDGKFKTGKEIIARIEKLSSNVKFFALSALGSNNCLHLNGNKMAFLRNRRALRVELPIVWLMHQNGLI